MTLVLIDQRIADDDGATFGCAEKVGDIRVLPATCNGGRGLGGDAGSVYRLCCLRRAGCYVIEVQRQTIGYG